MSDTETAFAQATAADTGKIFKVPQEGCTDSILCQDSHAANGTIRVIAPAPPLPCPTQACSSKTPLYKDSGIVVSICNLAWSTNTDTL